MVFCVYDFTTVDLVACLTLSTAVYSLKSKISIFETYEIEGKL